jgi:hypothetical protein
LTRMLNTDIETIKQFYYSHKSFKQSRNESVEDIVFPPTGNGTDGRIVSNNRLMINHPMINHQNNQTNYPITANYQNINNLSNNGMNRHSVIPGPTNGSLSGGANHNEDNNTRQSGKYFQMIENENRMLDEIIKNYRMKRQLRKLYVDDKLDRKSRDLYEKLLKK